jgi:hypothetical protein
MTEPGFAEILRGIDTGAVIPYLGPGVLSLCTEHSVPKSPAELVARITAQSPVPAKLRNNLGGATQFIENFKHRQTLRRAMNTAFAPAAKPNALHRFVAEQTKLRLVVYAWYDALLCQAHAARSDWALVQGASRADHRELWTRCFDASGTLASDAIAETVKEDTLLLYMPLGCVWPEGNYLVSDSDYVEVLTEIDIQTPIPAAVQQLRAGRNFLFLGCRFNTQLERQMALQIMKRSSDQHWAVLADEPTKNEAHFMKIYNIQRIAEPLEEFVARLTSKDIAQ